MSIISSLRKCAGAITGTGAGIGTVTVIGAGAAAIGVGTGITGVTGDGTATGAVTGGEARQAPLLPE
jgi:hypothetical protein